MQFWLLKGCSNEAYRVWVWGLGLLGLTLNNLPF